MNKTNDTSSQDKKNMIDTDNDGKLRQKGDTSDHGDPKSPFGKGHQDAKDSDSNKDNANKASR